MVLLTTEQTHDEINLFRLVRRLEKSVELPRSSSRSSSYSSSGFSSYSDSPSSSYNNSPYLYVQKDLDGGESEVEFGSGVWGRAQKDLQKVKYARKLLKSVEGYDTGDSHSSTRQRRLQILKTTLDTIESTLSSIPHPSPPAPPKSILAQLPPPPDAQTPSEDEGGLGLVEPVIEKQEGGPTTPKQKPTPLPLPLMSDNFLLSPPDPQGPVLSLPSSGLVSAIPGLNSAGAGPVPVALAVPRGGTSTALEGESAFGESWVNRRRSFNPNPTLNSTTSTSTSGAGVGVGVGHQKGKGTEAHTHLHTTLTDQLAQMATQLKHNALHFANSLEADKAVVETAQTKLEANMSFMETQRGRLKVLGGKTGGTTWLTLGIVLVTVLLFMVMVGVIRVLRI